MDPATALAEMTAKGYNRKKEFAPRWAGAPEYSIRSRWSVRRREEE